MIFIGESPRIKSKKCYQYSLDNEFIKEWHNSTDAGKSLEMSCSSIRNCLSGLSKTANNYKWSYLNEEEYKQLIKIKKEEREGLSKDYYCDSSND